MAETSAKLVWLEHQRGCERCREFEGVLCAEGSKLFRAATEERRTKTSERAPEGEEQK